MDQKTDTLQSAVTSRIVYNFAGKDYGKAIAAYKAEAYEIAIAASTHEHTQSTIPIDATLIAKLAVYYFEPLKRINEAYHKHLGETRHLWEDTQLAGKQS